MQNNLQYLRFSRLEEIETLGARWRQLHASQPQPLLPLTHLWHLAWFKNFGEDLDLAVGCVARNGQIIAIAPLYATQIRRHGITLAATQLASNGYSPMCDLLLAPGLKPWVVDQILHLLLINSPGQLLRLSKLPRDGIVAERAPRRAKLPAAVGIEESLSTPVIRLRDDWDTFLKSRSKSSRKSIRRKLKRLQDCERMTVREVVLENSEDPVLKEIVGVSARSWKADEESDLQSDTQGRKFLWQLIDELGPQGDASAWLLYDDGVLIAYELHLSYAGIVYPIRADFDRDHAQTGPGSILMARVLQLLFERKQFHTYDSCGNDYQYLRSWTDETYNYIDLELYSRGARALMAYALKHRVVPMARRASRQLGGLAYPGSEGQKIGNA